LLDLTEEPKKILVLRSKFLELRLERSDVACLAPPEGPLGISVLGFPLFSNISQEAQIGEMAFIIPYLLVRERSLSLKDLVWSHHLTMPHFLDY
jgi:hypothetical protein